MRGFSEVVTGVWAWKAELNLPDVEEGKAGGTVKAKARRWWWEWRRRKK